MDKVEFYVINIYIYSRFTVIQGQMAHASSNPLVSRVKLLCNKSLEYNHGHNILRLSDALPIFSLTARKMKCDC